MTIQVASYQVQITTRYHVPRRRNVRRAPSWGPATVAPDVAVCLGACCAVATLLGAFLSLVAGGAL